LFVQLAAAEVTRDEEDERHADFYFQPYVQEAVQQYLQTMLTPQEK
jgi:hypothetical protein